MQTFTTSDNLKLRYKLDGKASNPPLILSNSLGTRLEMWDDQIADFTKHFHVIRYDKRGHGLSENKAGPTGFSRLSQDAIELLDHLKVEKAAWCGLSMGGMSGMWLAANAPHRFTRFALTCTSPHMGSPDIYNGRIKFVRENGMTILRPLVIDRWFTKGFMASNPAEVARVGDMVESTSPEGYISCCIALRDMDMREMIRSIKAPCLVVSGTHDQATPVEHGRMMAQSIIGSEFVEVNGAHLSNVEAKSHYTKSVLDFLRA